MTRDLWNSLNTAATILAARAVQSRNWARVRDLEGIASIAWAGLQGQPWPRWRPEYDALLQLFPTPPSSGEYDAARRILDENAAERRRIARVHRAERREAALRPYREAEERRLADVAARESAAISTLYRLADAVERKEIAPAEALSTAHSDLTFLGFTKPSIEGLHYFVVAEAFRDCAKAGRKPSDPRRAYLWARQLRSPVSSWV